MANRGRNSRSGASSQGAPEKIGSWEDWNDRTKDEQKKARETSRKGGGDTPMWRLRMDLTWRPTTDPGAGERNPDVDDIEYDPIRMRIVRQTEPLCISYSTDDNGNEIEDDVFFSYYATWVQTAKGKRFVISNSRNGEVKVPCLLWVKACVADDERRKNFIADQNFGLEIELLEDFHILEKTGASGFSFYEWARCAGTDAQDKSVCVHCGNGLETVFGRKVFWTLWAAQKKQLAAEIEKVAENCASCKEGTINTYGYECYGEECSHIFVNKKDGDDYTEDDESFYQNEEVECPECKLTTYASPLFECLTRKGYGSNRRWETGCDEPNATDPYDYILTIRTKKVGNGAGYEVVDFELIDEEDLPELTGIAPALQKLDLHNLFGVSSLHDQAHNLGMSDNPPFDLDSAQAALNAHFAAGVDEEDADSEPLPDDDERTGDRA